MIIYKTINLINNKIYIGQDRNNNPNYLGSGKKILRAIKKYGKQNFKREILFEFNNIEEALLKESQLVNSDFIKNDLTYNLVTGGICGRAEIVHNKNKISVFSKKLNKILYRKRKFRRIYRFRMGIRF